MKRYLNILKDERGQSMVEFVVVLPVLLLFFYCIIYLSDIYIIKQNALTASRYAAWKLSRPNPPSCAALKNKISDYFFEGTTINLNCTPSNFRAGNDKPDLASRGMGMVNTILSKVVGSASSKLYHAKVDYPVPVPPGLAALDHDNTLSSITITGEHFVEGNAWSGFEVAAHDVFGMIKCIFLDVISFFPGINAC